MYCVRIDEETLVDPMLTVKILAWDYRDPSKNDFEPVSERIVYNESRFLTQEEQESLLKVILDLPDPSNALLAPFFKGPCLAVIDGTTFHFEVATTSHEGHTTYTMFRAINPGTDSFSPERHEFLSKQNPGGDTRILEGYMLSFAALLSWYENTTQLGYLIHYKK